MKLLTQMMRKQAGQALPMALILMLLGGLLIVPLLDLTTINLKATQSVDLHTRELYAADAGVEDALWYLQSEDRLSIINPDDTWPMDPYNLEPVNERNVQVSIDHAWLLGGLPDLPEDEPLLNEPDYANDHWTLIGALNIDVQPRNNYIVDITTNEPAGTAYVDHIGVWLPQGYSYAAGTVKINGVDHLGNALVKEPDAPVPYRGGNVYEWNYFGTAFKSLSDIALPPPGGGVTPSQKFPPSVRLSFDYTVTPFKEARGFFPWIMLSTGRTAWDTDAGFYHVTSVGTTPETGTNTTVEAYVPKGVARYVSGSSGASSAIQGDYIAIGNSLMTCCWNSGGTGPPTGQVCTCTTTCCGDNPYRNYPPAPIIFTVAAGYPDGERESYATVNSIGADAVPDDAKIERAYLYWTAWLRGDRLWTESGKTWNTQWNQYMGLDSVWDNAPVPSELKGISDWVKANAYDGNAYLAVNDMKVTPKNAGDRYGTVLADTWYISRGSSDVQPSYQYACFADVTAQVTSITTALPNTKFTVAGVRAHPASPCNSPQPNATWNRSSNAGWSMIIIYSSAEKKTHQIYLYPGCQHLFNTTSEFTIAGFAAPSAADLEPGETNEAKMTVFASEGDASAAEYLGFKGQNTNYYQLNDAASGTTGGVFNSRSSAGGFTPSTINTCPPTGQISGIDIDTYTDTRPTGGTHLYDIVHPLDTSAKIKVQSTGDGFELIYVVFSVRSTAVPAGQEFNVGTMLYRIE